MRRAHALAYRLHSCRARARAKRLANAVPFFRSGHLLTRTLRQAHNCHVTLSSPYEFFREFFREQA